MASSTTYEYPVTGTTAPVASGTFAAVTALVTFLDADTTATVTHNFALTAGENTQLFPLVSLIYDSTTSTTLAAPFAVLKGLNTITITKASAAGSGCTLQVQILKPNTMIR